MPSKNFILSEIRRTSEENGGNPLGMKRFAETTGVKKYDWFGKLWASWGDAVREAGLEANSLQGAYADGWLLEQFSQLALRNWRRRAERPAHDRHHSGGRAHVRYGPAMVPYDRSSTSPNRRSIADTSLLVRAANSPCRARLDNLPSFCLRKLNKRSMVESGIATMADTRDVNVS